MYIFGRSLTIAWVDQRVVKEVLVIITHSTKFLLI